MKKTRLIAALLALVLAFSLFAGCSNNAGDTGTPSDSPSPSAEPSASPSDTAEPDTSDAEPAIKFTDMADREVTLDAPAKTIVALMPADCEILYAIGAGDTIIGRTDYCNYPEELLSVTNIATDGTTNMEQIIALQPDVVIMGYANQMEEPIKTLEDAGITVVISRAEDIDATYQSITQLGILTGKTDKADALIDSMKTSFDEIRKNVAESKTEEKTVYFEISPLEWGLWTAGTGTFMNEFAEMLGVTNIFADVDAWGQVSEEQVIERNPDFIVTNTTYMGEGMRPEEEILSRAGWQDISAIVNGKVFNTDADIISRPGPRLVTAAQMLFDFIYGA